MPSSADMLNTEVDVANFSPVEDDWQSADPAFKARMGQTTAPFSQAEALSVAPKVPVMTDEEAAAEFRAYPYKDIQQRQEADLRFNQYYEEQDHKKAGERLLERQDQLLNDESRKAYYQTPEVIQAVRNNASPQDMYNQHVITGVLENDVLHRKLAPGEYEAARDAIIGQRMAGVPTINDSQAMSVLKERAKEEQAAREVLDKASVDITKDTLEALAANKPYGVGDAWDKARKGMPDAAKGSEDDLYKLVAGMANDTKELVTRNGQAMGLTYGYLMKEHAGTATDEDRKAAYDALRAVPQEDLNDTLDFIVKGVKTGEIDKNAFIKFIMAERDIALSGYGLIPAVKGIGNTATDLRLSAMRGQLDSGKARMNAKGHIVWFPDVAQSQRGFAGIEEAAPAQTRELTDDEKRRGYAIVDELADLNRIDRAVKVAVDKVDNEQIFDPKFAKGVPEFLTQHFFGAQKQVGPMVLAGLSFPLYFTTIASQSYEQKMYENPQMHKGAAFAMASAEAGINWIIDNAQFEGLTGGSGVRWLQGFMSKVPGGKPLGRLAGIGAFETATEISQDVLSNLAKRGMAELIEKFDPTIDVGKKQTFDDIMQDFLDSAPGTATEMFFLSAVGAGIMTYRDVKDPMRSLYSDDILKRAGLNRETRVEIQWEPDFAKRDQLLREAIKNRTVEDINNGILYAQEQDAKIKAAVEKKGAAPVDPAAATTPHESFVPPTLVAVKLADGTRGFNLVDKDGKVVMQNMTEGVANEEWTKLYQQTWQEHQMEFQQQRQSEAEVSRQAAAEVKWNALTPQQKTSTAHILEFSYATKPTAEQQKQLDTIHAALKEKGVPDQIEFVVPDNPATKAGRNTLAFIQWFERTFNKTVQFVASKDGQPLSFSGLTLSSHPNTIFLDAAGNRNVLSLLGHEWSHTLEHTNPILWKDMLAKMKPMVVDWAKQAGKIDPSYDPEDADSEFVANIIGDAFGDPDFWKVVRDRHSGLFERMLASVKEWFDTVITRVSEWGTQAEDVIKDLQGMRNLIAQAMEKAREGSEVATPREGDIATTITPAMETDLRAMGYTAEQIAQMPAAQAHMYTQVPKVQMAIRAYQGSKIKDIREFLLKFITTGEGNVTFGWGLYFAENPDVARRYRALLGGVEGGALYTLDLNVHHGELLDLDRRMHDQPPAVLEKIQNSNLYKELAATDPSFAELFDPDAQYDGEEFQKMLMMREVRKLRGEGENKVPFTKAMETEAKRRVSEWLRDELGIPGNTFADGFSRNKWKIALHDYYEAMDNAKADQATMDKYKSHPQYEQFAAEARQLKEDAWNALAAAKEEGKITNNFVIWDEKRIDLAPEGARLHAATRRREPYKPERPVDSKTKEALDEDKKPLYGAARSLPKGTPVGVRIDIPAFLSHGVYAQTIHGPKTGGTRVAGAGTVGPRIGYDNMAFVDNPRFWANEKAAQQIKEGHAKFSMATVEGNYDPTRTIPPEVATWTPVGFNPHKHSYFYDKNTGEMVTGGTRALSTGNTVWVQNPTFGDRTKALFASRKAEAHKFEARGERQVDENGGYINKAEEDKIDSDIDAWLDENGIKPGARRDRIKEQARLTIHADVYSTRARNPDKPTEKVTDPWSPLTVTGAKLTFKDAKEGEEPDVKSEAKWQKQGYRFDEIPEGMTRQQWAQELGQRVMTQYIERIQLGLHPAATKSQRENMDTIIRELEWYREFTTKLRQDFGGAADFMADLLGAFSPRQNVKLNWRNAVDAIWAISHGKYDNLLKQLDAYLKLDPNNTIDSWRKLAPSAEFPLGGGVMNARSGALFGTNTDRGMTAALGLWREIRSGDKPKAKNFTRNLIALSIRATIDVWAARLLDRVALKPRIPVEAEGAVEGQHMTKEKALAWLATHKEAPWSQDKLEGEHTETAAVLNLKTGKVGQGRHHAEAYEDAGIDLGNLDDDKPLSGKTKIPHMQGFVTNKGRFTDEMGNYIDITPDGEVDVFADGIPVEGQFAFGQEVFTHTAMLMRDPKTWEGSGIPQNIVDKFKNVTPADVQATNWFVEKEIWTERDWTNEEGAGGSFIHEIEQMLGTRFQVGLSQQVTGREDREDFLPQDADQAQFSHDVAHDLARVMPDVISMRALDSLGMYMKSRERTLDIEMTHGPGLEPNDVMRVVLAHAQAKDQEATHLSRVIHPDEDVRENARPGLEVYFKTGVTLKQILPITRLLGQRQINGFTMIVDPRAKVGAKEFIGVRFQYIPEYAGDVEGWAKNADKVRKKLRRAHEKILSMEGVATVRQQEYDTVVFKKGIDYDTEGVNPGAIGTSEARAWRKRYFDSVATRAAIRNARDVLAPATDEHDVSNREPAEEEIPSGLAPPPVTITSFDASSMKFIEHETVPTQALVRQLKAEARRYDDILECLKKG